MPESTLRRVAVVLAATSAVLVLAVAGLAGQRYAGRGTTTAPSTTTVSTPGSPTIETPTGVAVPTPSVFPGGQIVFGSADRDAVFEAPRGWNATRGYWGLEVAKSFTGLLPQAYDAARYGLGWCPKDDAESRAYVGWGPLTNRFGTDARRATHTFLRSWDTGYHYDIDPRYYFPPRATAVTTLRLDDGTTAWVGSITGAIRDDKCPTITASQVTVLAFRNPAGHDVDSRLMMVVGYRDIGTGRDVSQGEILRILRTARGLRQ